MKSVLQILYVIVNRVSGAERYVALPIVRRAKRGEQSNVLFMESSFWHKWPSPVLSDHIPLL